MTFRAPPCTFFRVSERFYSLFYNESIALSYTVIAKSENPCVEIDGRVEVTNVSAASDDILNEWSYTVLPPYTFMGWVSVMHSW